MTGSNSASLIAALGAEPCRAIEAAREIAHTQQRDAIPRLLEVLRTTDDHNVRNAIAMALSDLHEPTTVDEVVRLLSDRRTLGSRGTLLHALQPFDCSPLLSVLMNFVIEGNHETSREAMALLCSIEAPIDDDDWAGHVARLKAAMQVAADERKPLIREVLSMLGVELPHST